jgi:hypothetical protein
MIWRVRAVGEENTPIKCLYRFTNKSLNRSFEIEKSGVTTSFLRSGLRLKGILREKKDVTASESAVDPTTYRNFKVNAVLGKFESYISLNDKGKYRGQRESERLRSNLLKEYEKKIDSTFET